MLPTPRASDGHGRCLHGEGGLDLTTTVADMPHPPERPDDRWGGYGVAVARWEHLLGRPVPEPTQAGRHDKPVLAPAFVEWLMGLPEGWVTDPDLALPRTRALRVLGNGVVRQQAAAALRLLTCPAPLGGTAMTGLPARPGG
jgi:DNA (cytosine-5)-methyltransferase 1